MVKNDVHRLPEQSPLQVEKMDFNKQLDAFFDESTVTRAQQMMAKDAMMAKDVDNENSDDEDMEPGKVSKRPAAKVGRPKGKAKAKGKASTKRQPKKRPSKAPAVQEEAGEAPSQAEKVEGPIHLDADDEEEPEAPSQKDPIKAKPNPRLPKEKATFARRYKPEKDIYAGRKWTAIKDAFQLILAGKVKKASQLEACSYMVL